MKKIIRNAVFAAFMLIAGLGVSKAVAMAAEAIQVAVPVAITNTGAVPSSAETYQIELKADDESYPMPEGSVEGVYTMEVTGAQQTAFPEITFSKLGVYTYTVSQKAGGNNLCTYDDTVFQLKIYVVNGENGTFASTVVVREEGAEEKEEISFENFYAEPPAQPVPVPEPDPDTEIPAITAVSTVSVVKKWNDDGKDRPASVTVQLMNGETVCDTVTLDNWNDWTYKWDNLDINGQWKVQEINIPNGYTPSYSLSDGVVTITNTKTLVKTGQLNWPIPVLATIGIIILGAGLMMVLKERKDKYAS